MKKEINKIDGKDEIDISIKILIENLNTMQRNVNSLLEKYHKKGGNHYV